MTPDELTRLRELDAKASPAPWEITHSRHLETMEGVGLVIEDSEGGTVAEADSDFGHHSLFIDDALPLMVELRNALPILLTEIERLTAENTQLLDTVAEAWDEGYLDKEAEAGGVMIHLEPRERAENPYKKDN